MQKNNILFLFVIFLTLLFLFGCSFDKFFEKSVEKNKNESIEKQKTLTLNKFKSTCKNFGYEVEDIKDFNKEDIKTITIAKKKDFKKGYRIEFYTTKDDKTALYLFTSDESDFEEQYKKSHNLKKIITKSHGDNFNYFSIHIGKDYMIIYRVDNKFIYLKVDESNKKEVKALLKELGCYDYFSLFFDSLFESIGTFFQDLFNTNKKDSYKNEVSQKEEIKITKHGFEKGIQEKNKNLNKEQFIKISSKYGFKTYEEIGLDSKKYKGYDEIDPKVKDSIMLVYGDNNYNMSSSKFLMFEDEKTAENYVTEKRKVWKQLYPNATENEIVKNHSKRTVIINSSGKDISNIELSGYIYSQQNCNVIEIIYIGKDFKIIDKMLNEMGHD